VTATSGAARDAAVDQAARWLAEQLPAMEDELARLVEQNSFTDHREGGLAAGETLRSVFAIDGLTAASTPSECGRFADHLVFSTAAKGPRVLLLGHLDTVFPPGIFEGYRKDGDLRRGPGVLDMKGGLVVVAYALRALAEASLLPGIAADIVIVADEEVGSPEGKAIIASRAAEADAALVFEAGRAEDAIILARKGTGGVTAIATGKAAHAGNNHADGANAIWALARFVDQAQRLTDYGRGRTVNVGKIEGGQSKNTVPDSAKAELDLRFESKVEGEQLVKELHEAASRITAEVPGTQIELRGGIARAPLERTGRSEALGKSYGDFARVAGLGSGFAKLLGGGSDANTTSALGIASIDGLGPRGKGFHTKDEQIEIATMIPKAEALLRYLASRALIV
jgi:glutamate carboxypeptidase